MKAVIIIIIIITIVTPFATVFSQNPADPVTSPPLVHSTTLEINIHLDEELQNTTRFEGETIRLRCEITGSLLKYVWYRNNAKIEKGTPRFSVKTTAWGSRLKIESLQKQDEGHYKCIGSNQFGQTSTGAYLGVKPGSNPNRSWNKNEADLDIDPDSETIDPDADIQPIYPESPNKHLLNSDLNKKYKEQGQWTDNGPKSNDAVGFCQGYVGSACSKFLANQSVFVLDLNHQEMQEEWIAELFSSLSQSKEISHSCKQYLVPAICVSAFSKCHQNDAESNRRVYIKASKSKKLCKEECEALKSIHCKEEYSEKNLQKLSQPPPNILDKIMLDQLGRILNALECKNLKNSQRSDTCTTAHIPLSLQYDDSKCYLNDGYSYRGTISVTQSRKVCSRWTEAGAYYEQNDHTPGLILMGHNFCRNADRSWSAPWCFVESDNGQVKELCDIPLCELDQKSGYYNSLLIGVPCVFVVILIITIIICTRVRRQADKKKNVADKVESQNLQPNNTSQVQMKSLMDRQSFQSCGTPPYIAPGNISLSYELFDNLFGKVYRGEILPINSPMGSPTIPAIFRTLDATATPKMQTDFWKEIDKVCDFHHPNITAVLGMNKTSQPYFVAFEASTYGDLTEYLKSNSEIVKCPPSETGNVIRASILPHTVLISIAVQIASALEFLHSKNFIHSELNSQNVLVCENGVVKISLATPGNGPNYFKLAQGKPILLRWSPPEVLTTFNFSDKSDVWSFGVLLWEIYSAAATPYIALSDMEVIEVIRSVRILSCPTQCPTEMYALMIQCWHKIPASRPTAAEVHDQLRQSWTELNRAPSINPSVGSDQSQVNTNQNNSHAAYEPQQPLLQQLPFLNYHSSSSSNQLITNRLLPSHSSSASQKSSPASSSCNYKPIGNVHQSVEFSSSLGKHCYMGNEVYTEQIV